MGILDRRASGQSETVTESSDNSKGAQFKSNILQRPGSFSSQIQSFNSRGSPSIVMATQKGGDLTNRTVSASRSIGCEQRVIPTVDGDSVIDVLGTDGKA